MSIYLSNLMSCDWNEGNVYSLKVLLKFIFFIPGNSYSDDRRRSQYTDNHQVFVGNIPHNAVESELRVR